MTVECTSKREWKYINSDNILDSYTFERENLEGGGNAQESLNSDKT